MAVFKFSLGHFTININCLKEKHIVSNISLQTQNLIKISKYLFFKKNKHNDASAVGVPDLITDQMDPAPMPS